MHEKSFDTPVLAVWLDIRKKTLFTSLMKFIKTWFTFLVGTNERVLPIRTTRALCWCSLQLRSCYIEVSYVLWKRICNIKKIFHFPESSLFVQLKIVEQKKCLENQLHCYGGIYFTYIKAIDCKQAAGTETDIDKEVAYEKMWFQGLSESTISRFDEKHLVKNVSETRLASKTIESGQKSMLETI